MSEYCIYLRKSRADIEAEERGEGETLARHQSTLLELARRQGLSITKMYKEIVSGDSIAARPQMQSLLADISEGKYDGVLVMEIERLARGDTIDQGVVAQAFRESGTKIITPIKTYDPNNEFDEEYFEFSLFMSRREYKTIKRRMQAGRLASIKEGNYISSSDPYGYRRIHPKPKVHTLEIVPEEAEVVKMIYKLYLDGHGAKYIAAELNRMGIIPKKSHFWESPSIKKILSNPLYCGKIGWKTKSNGNTLYQGKHEAIISEEIFNDAQIKKSTNPAAQLHPNDKLLNYYHGVMYCKNCGHQLKRRVITARGYEHLLCTYRQCRGITVSASFKEIDDAVLAAFRYHIGKLRELILNGVSPSDSPNDMYNKRIPVEAELKKARKQLSKLYDLLEQEVYDVNTFVERSKLVNGRIKALEDELKNINSATVPKKLPPEEILIRLEYIVDNFEEADPDEKNRMLKSVASKIYYSKTERMCKNKDKSDLNLEINFL
jgi:resolvase